ncbi:MAG: histidine triad nucleotide-binding protein [Gammaproteobacteria bacterium]|tara:strand:- start:166 stop:501 length:336 start_codon:yes stop_codon:yes gene_type:complete
MTLFQKIIDKEIPADIIYEDDLSLVFKDINPQAPTHLLIIPKKPIVKVADASEADKELLGHLMWVAGEVAREIGVEDAFRLVINNGAKAGQSVFHLHLHLLSGRSFSWPPG